MNTFPDSRNRLKLLLSFSVGGLLGDVFLHLLPEAWTFVIKSSGSLVDEYFNMGLWVVSGISTLLAIEMIFTLCGSSSSSDDDDHHDDQQFKVRIWFNRFYYNVICCE